MSDIRIIEMPAADSVEDNDFLALDNNTVAQSNDDTTAGTRKIRAKDFIDDNLTKDETPTEDSTNPVESGGVYDALESINDKVSQLEVLGSASGSIATFSDGSANPLKDLKFTITPVQSGSGDPSPTNIRPISGWDGANVWVQAEADPTAEATYNVSWQTEAGTVYGGSIDVVSGVLTVDRAIFTIDGTESDNDIGVTTSTGFTQISYVPYISVGKGNETFVCNKLTNVSVSNKGLYKIWNNNSTSSVRMFLGLPDTVTTKAEAHEWFTNNPIEVVYELATPTTYQLSPTQVLSLLADNNIFADVGDCVECTYVRDLNIAVNDLEQGGGGGTTYTAGTNIQISAQNVISATDTKYTAGTGISLSGTTINNSQAYTELTGTLNAGSTSLTLSNAVITTSKTFDYYTSIFGVNPTNVTVSSGSMTLTFEAQSSNMNVKVRVS